MTGSRFGVQVPRFVHRPVDVVRNDADDAAGLIADAGMPLDPWQRTVLECWLGVRSDGSWAARTAGVVVARQNGKNAILEARELAGLFLFGERRIVHSAHRADTAEEAFKRMATLIESVPWLDSEVAAMPKSPGRFAIRLRDGAELSYRTRTKKGGRGFSAPVVVLDEAQDLTGEQLAAIRPLVSSFPSHQMIYTGTVLAGASVFEGVVKRGRAGLGDALGYAEWSAPEDCDPADPEAWLQANPSVGYRMGLDTIEDEWLEFSAAGVVDRFLEERLSIWPATGGVGSVIPLGPWETSCATGWRPPADVTGGVAAVAVSMDRKYACVGYVVPGDVVAGEERPYGEVVAETDVNRPGIDWVVPYLAGLQARRRPEAVVVDKAGPAFPLVNGLIAAGMPVKITELADFKSACAQYVDRVEVGRFAHAGQTQLTESAAGVQRRWVGDGWVYDRKTPRVLVAPVEAVTLAVWGLVGAVKRRSKYESGNLLVL